MVDTARVNLFNMLLLVGLRAVSLVAGQRKEEKTLGVVFRTKAVPR